jgi:hypothetical protein
MAGCGRRGKTKCRFSLAAHEPLEIAERRDSHIPARPGHYPRGKVEIQKQDSHFPTLVSLTQKIQKRKEPPLPVTLLLQAHLWIRKD